MTVNTRQASTQVSSKSVSQWDFYQHFQVTAPSWKNILDEEIQLLKRQTNTSFIGRLSVKVIKEWLRVGRVILLYLTSVFWAGILAGINCEPTINLGGKNIRRVSKANSWGLGIFTDENLNWYHQIDNISKKVYNGIGILRRANY